MSTVKVDVIIPAYRPDGEFDSLLERLSVQKYPINKILVMNTEKKFWKEQWERDYPLVEVHHLAKEEFDHGATRRKAVRFSDAEILVFMTQDALPSDRDLIGNLVSALHNNENAGAAYARQLPKADCRFLEKYTRSFNYPSQSCVKTEKDVQTRGIKTYFCSNVCAMYRRDIYLKMGGFVTKTIFNEDMIMAANMVQAGYQIAYAAEAKVVHAHKYTYWQQLTRNFDMAVSQRQYREIFESVKSESEGIRLVKQTASYLLHKGKWYLVPDLVMQSGFKFIGYKLGLRYEKLPMWFIRKVTMNPRFWREQENR